MSIDWKKRHTLIAELRGLSTPKVHTVVEHYVSGSEMYTGPLRRVAVSDTVRVLGADWRVMDTYKQEDHYRVLVSRE